MKIPLSDISIIYEPSFAGSNWTTWKLRHEPTGIEEEMDWESFESALKYLVSAVERHEREK
ncbi:MAG: hypothetical protein GTO54_12880 [Nitrososphaeria archaeon]|nr:hypothetical protein [Nitrososphaeria archaeon]